jgi:hypothetical protein
MTFSLYFAFANGLILRIVVPNHGVQLHNIIPVLQTIPGSGIPAHPKRSSPGSKMGKNSLYPSHNTLLLSKPGILFQFTVSMLGYWCFSRGYTGRNG